MKNLRRSATPIFYLSSIVAQRTMHIMSAHNQKQRASRTTMYNTTGGKICKLKITVGLTLIKSSIFLLAMYLHGKSCVAEALSHLLPDCVEALEAVGANGGRSQQGVWRPGRA